MSLPSAKKRKIFDGRYEVLSIVGRGLDSVVYHARHLSGPEQEVALKVLINNKPKSSLTERLRKEALTLVSCRHKYVVRLDDFHSVADLCYLSMEYAPLGDLRKYIAARGTPLSPEQGTEFLRQSLEGMEFIHATGVLHRDLKPDNILVINDKEIRLADFGLALLPGDELDLEELQNGVGSLSYLPPEMLDGQFYDSRSDLYSLGVCFYEALAGFHPFDQAPLSEQKEARLDKNIKPLHEVNPLIPTHISAVVATLMRYSADERFQTAMEALRTLSNTAYSGNTTSVTSEPLAPETDDFDVQEASNNAATSKDPTTAANNDSVDQSFTDVFEDFFSETAQSPATGHVAADSSGNDTEEMTAQRVQQLIDNDTKTKSAGLARREFTSESKRSPTLSPSEPSQPPKEELVSEDFKRPATGPRKVQSKQGLLADLFTMHPALRTFVVGLSAAIITVGLVLLSHLKPTQILSGNTDVPGGNQEVTDDEQPENSSPSLLQLPAGTYAGRIEGLLPGTTSPLALIVRPEHNDITVVIGIEGWTPTTVSTEVNGDDNSPVIVVRSNSVLLNMSGDLSENEVVGTFSNAITGETGVWSARKIS